MIFKLLILSIIFNSFISCNSSKFVIADARYTKIGLDLKAEQVVIEDKRKNIATEDLKLPFISHHGQYNIISPPLQIDHEAIIRETILENVSLDNSNSSIITVQILKARKEFSANFWAEKETSFVELKISANFKGREIEVIESGEFFNKSIDATYKRSEKIYRNALKEVTYKALEKLKKMISG